MIKSERILSPILFLMILISALGFFYSTWKLKKEGVYTLGKITSASSDAGMGWTYDYTYQLNGSTYHSFFNGSLKSFMSQDSLVFIKVLVDKPNEARIVKDEQVPNCFKYLNVPKEGWNEIPTCKP